MCIEKLHCLPSALDHVPSKQIEEIFAYYAYLAHEEERAETRRLEAQGAAFTHEMVNGGNPPATIGG